MSRAWPGTIAWLAGLGGLLALPAGAHGTVVGVAWIACALAALLAFTGGVLRGREVMVDAAFVLAVASIAVRDPDAASLASQAFLLGSSGVLLLGTALALQAMARADAPLRGIALQGATTLGLAVLATLVVLRLPSWMAPLVSERWTGSLDATSVDLMAVLGLLATLSAAGFTVLRVVLRGRSARPARPVGADLPTSQ